MKREKECEGCLAKCYVGTIVNRRPRENCPCKICLVKITCEDICYNFYKYVLKKGGYREIPGLSVYRSTRYGVNEKTSSWSYEDTIIFERSQNAKIPQRNN